VCHSAGAPRGVVCVCESQRIECLDQRRVPKPACPNWCVLPLCQSKVTKPTDRIGASPMMMQSFPCIAKCVISVIQTHHLQVFLFAAAMFYRGSAVLSHHVG